jgi:hypothetical protein
MPYVNFPLLSSSHDIRAYSIVEFLDEKIEPYVHETNELEKQVTQLEHLAEELEAYSKFLESSVTKRISSGSTAVNSAASSGGSVFSIFK